jgi:peroxiredoxin Q/BCP
MLQEGQPAPPFTLKDGAGNTVSLSDFRGRKVVLYFYPKDDTPGCTKEACDFRDGHAQIRDRGAVILGMSPDDEKSHTKFAQKFNLPFTLLADPEGRTADAYGIWKEKSMYGRTYMGVERTTVIIDEEGIVRKIFPKVTVEGHYDAVLAALG